jgi:hypothetical protein
MRKRKRFTLTIRHGVASCGTRQLVRRSNGRRDCIYRYQLEGHFGHVPTVPYRVTFELRPDGCAADGGYLCERMSALCIWPDGWDGKWFTRMVEII